MPRSLIGYCCAQGLSALGYDIISTGGTATTVQSMGIPCTKVEDVTGFPEMLDGGYWLQRQSNILMCLLAPIKCGVRDIFALSSNLARCAFI